MTVTVAGGRAGRGRAGCPAGAGAGPAPSGAAGRDRHRHAGPLALHLKPLRSGKFAGRSASSRNSEAERASSRRLRRLGPREALRRYALSRDLRRRRARATPRASSQGKGNSAPLKRSRARAVQGGDLAVIELLLERGPRRRERHGGRGLPRGHPDRHLERGLARA